MPSDLFLNNTIYTWRLLGPSCFQVCGQTVVSVFCVLCWAYLDFGGGGEEGVVGVLHTLLLGLLGLRAHQQGEVGGQVPAQQRLVGGDVQQQGHSLHVKARLQNLPEMHAHKQ